MCAPRLTSAPSAPAAEANRLHIAATQAVGEETLRTSERFEFMQPACSRLPQPLLIPLNRVGSRTSSEWMMAIGRRLVYGLHFSRAAAAGQSREGISRRRAWPVPVVALSWRAARASLDFTQPLNPRAHPPKGEWRRAACWSWSIGASSGGPDSRPDAERPAQERVLSGRDNRRGESRKRCERPLQGDSMAGSSWPRSALPLESLRDPEESYVFERTDVRRALATGHAPFSHFPSRFARRQTLARTSNRAPCESWSGPLFCGSVHGPQPPMLCRPRRISANAIAF